MAEDCANHDGVLSMGAKPAETEQEDGKKERETGVRIRTAFKPECSFVPRASDLGFVSRFNIVFCRWNRTITILVVRWRWRALSQPSP